MYNSSKMLQVKLDADIHALLALRSKAKRFINPCNLKPKPLSGSFTQLSLLHAR